MKNRATKTGMETSGCSNQLTSLIELAIMQGVGGQIYESVVKPQLSDFMGQVFEEICRQYFYLPFVYETLPFPVGKIERWWGNNPKNNGVIFISFQNQVLQKN